jgi:hypothetical protein
MPVAPHRRPPAQPLSGLVLALLAAALGGGCATLADPGGAGAGTPGASVAPVAAAAPAKPAAATPPTAPAAVPAGSPPGPRATSATTPAPAAAAPAPGQPRAFADVVKDATETTGFFRVWQKDEKVWLEIAPEQFDLPFRFQMNHARGVGEARVYGGMMGPSHIARLRKVGPSVQLIAANTQYTAKAGTPIAAAVREGFSESMLGSAAIASQPHAERKSVLVELNALLLTDLPAASYFAWGVHQRGYTFDARNSSIERVHATEDGVSALVLAHYSNPKATLPPSPTAGPAANPYPPFDTLPDRRSLFLGVHYSFNRLAAPMRPRAADPRIGHFVEEVFDYTDDRSRTARVNFVQRWRLEKKDPSAALSEPVQPIVFWIDRNVPEQYRGAVREGILEWNKAFERIGFKDAIRVEVQPADADWSTSDGRHATVRWFAGADVGFAIGPRATDGRTGEILDAAVAIPEVWARGDRRLVREDLNTASLWPAFDAYKTAAGLDPRACTFATDALAEVEFGLDLLVARGDIAPDGPAAEAFVLASLKEVTMHEVGHTLGLRHNFRASTVYPLERLSDPAFTAENGLAGSVMDYPPVNLAPQGERQGQYHQSTLGPYDYWAIEYAYAPLEPATEAQDLARIAARGATDPLLAFSSDQESAAGIDPAASLFDFGDEPLAYLERRFRLSRELWARLQAKELAPGQPYDVLRRSFDSGLRQAARAAQLATKYVGGVTYVRDFAGTGRNPLTPVPPQKQRAALALLSEAVFAADSFRFPPEFLQRMGVDYLQVDGSAVNPDFSLSARVMSLQTGTLGQLLSDTVASRLLESESKVGADSQAFRLSELYATLQAVIWSELKTGKDIPLTRRNLQREHVNRVATVLLRPSASMPADARALQRTNAMALRTELATAMRRSGTSKEAQAHLAQAWATLDEALKAPVVRQSV